jgi:hypothetical protein
MAEGDSEGFAIETLECLDTEGVDTILLGLVNLPLLGGEPQYLT